MANEKDYNPWMEGLPEDDFNCDADEDDQEEGFRPLPQVKISELVEALLMIKADHGDLVVHTDRPGEHFGFPILSVEGPYECVKIYHSYGSSDGGGGGG